MTDFNQNFSIQVGDDIDVAYDIGPDTTGLNLDDAQQVTWKAYAQRLGAPDLTVPLIVKDKAGGGVEIDDPTALIFIVHLASIDTIGRHGNLYYEIKVVDANGKTQTPTSGLMTVIDPAVVPNVAAFKAMFPDLASTDDTLVQVALDHAGQFVDDTWGDSQADAVMYLAAHFLSTAHATADTDGRVVSSETIGRMSISYAVSTATGGNASTLGMTRYGLVFSTMLSAQGFGIAVV